MNPDPAAAAALLEREAGSLAEILDAVAVAAGPTTWQGPAADEFERALEDHRRLLRSVAEQLRATARRVLAGSASGPVLPSAPVAPTGRIRGSVV